MVVGYSTLYYQSNTLVCHVHEWFPLSRWKFRNLDQFLVPTFDSCLWAKEWWLDELGTGGSRSWVLVARGAGYCWLEELGTDGSRSWVLVVRGVGY